MLLQGVSGTGSSKSSKRGLSDHGTGERADGEEPKPILLRGSTGSGSGVVACSSQ